MSNDTILGRSINFAAARKTVRVECPELEGTFILRALSIAQLKEVDTSDVAQQFALMIVDESGARVFTSEEDIQNLREMSAGLSTRLQEAAMELNGWSKQAVEEAKKNSQATQSTGSASG